MDKIKMDWCDSTIFEEDDPLIGTDGETLAYPYSLSQTIHRYRLSDYAEMKGRNIFICYGADLFGDWVPDSRIEEMFKACEKVPQHNYLFLTKNPKRYVELEERGILKPSNNMWFGFTNTRTREYGRAFLLPQNAKTFVSIEPLLEPVRPYLTYWAIVGAETGRRKDKVIPKREWIEQIVEDCREYGVPIFMKQSLAEIWGEPLIQEFPEELKK